MTFIEVYPNIETAIELESEELAMFILKHLEDERNISRHNYTLESNPGLRDYAQDKTEVFTRRLMEAWMWLEKEILIAPNPGSDGNWFFITRRGRQLLESQDYSTYRKESLLNSEKIDPVLIRKVRSSFIRGDYELAVLQAFKEVEIKIRAKAGLSSSDIGVNLARKAFNVASGALTNQTADPGEKQAIGDLYAGALGLFKNPASHREVNYDDPQEVADLISFANQLLRMLER